MTAADRPFHRPRVLLDTGPLVALLNADDRDHASCRRWFEGFEGVLLTTEAVLTEATHLLARDPAAQQAAVAFFERRAAVLVPMTLPALRRARELMGRFSDVPMDFADATLVTLSEELDVLDVATLDRRGFGAYRGARGKAFRIVPDGRRPRRAT